MDTTTQTGLFARCMRQPANDWPVDRPLPWAIIVQQWKDGILYTVAGERFEWDQFPPASAGHRLIEMGYMINDRTAGTAGWSRVDGLGGGLMWEGEFDAVWEAQVHALDADPEDTYLSTYACMRCSAAWTSHSEATDTTRRALHDELHNAADLLQQMIPTLTPGEALSGAAQLVGGVVAGMSGDAAAATLRPAYAFETTRG